MIKVLRCSLSEGFFAFSNDGINWKRTPKPGLSDQFSDNVANRHDKIAFNNGNWVAAGSNVLHSTNLVDWTEVLTDGGVSLASGKGQFVFISWSGQKYTSPNGVDWTDHGEDPHFTGGGSEGFGIAYGNGRFVAVQDGSYTSENGIDWVASTR